MEFLVGPLRPGEPVNLADALVAPNVLRPFLVNWAEVVRYFIRSVEADADTDGSEETAALLARLLAYQGVRSAIKSPMPEPAGGPVLAMRFPQGRDEAGPVHDHCDARDAPGRHGPGASSGELLPPGRGDGSGASCLGGKGRDESRAVTGGVHAP